MNWLQNTVTRRHNVRHQAWGRLFGDRYKSVLVDGADTYHYRTLADYIHLNPVRARLVQPRKGQSVLDYPWSSVAGGWALPPGKRPKWLAAKAGLKRFDLPDTVAGRRRMVERLDRRAVEEEIEKCGGSQREKSAKPERLRSTEAGSGRDPLETDNRFAGMDRCKSIDTQRGEREPATAPV